MLSRSLPAIVEAVDKKTDAMTARFFHCQNNLRYGVSPHFAAGDYFAAAAPSGGTTSANSGRWSEPTSGPSHPRRERITELVNM